MIHVNARAIIERTSHNKKELLIQTRARKGEPSWHELPGGRIEEFESVIDAVKREVMEETGLVVTKIWGSDTIISTTSDSFDTECIKPYAIYQTTSGPVDSFGAYFVCHASGELIKSGDDTKNPSWVSIDHIKKIIADNKFSPIDKAAVIMYIKENTK